MSGYSEPAPRRTFLRGLVALPLVGGGLAISGDPVAAAVPTTDELLDAYAHFLHHEKRALVRERYAHLGADMVRAMERGVPCGTLADRLHFPLDGQPLARPSSRAALILSAAGVPVA